MRNYITADDVANGIRMARTQFRGTFLIVEGQTADFRVYKRLVDSKQTKITPAHNKDNALAALKILEDARRSRELWPSLMLIFGDLRNWTQHVQICL